MLEKGKEIKMKTPLGLKEYNNHRNAVIKDHESEAENEKEESETGIKREKAKHLLITKNQQN